MNSGSASGEPLEPLRMGIRELAEHLGVPLETVRRWRKHRQGPRGYRVGKHIRFRESEVEAWLQNQREAS